MVYMIQRLDSLTSCNDDIDFVDAIGELVLNAHNEI